MPPSAYGEPPGPDYDLYVIWCGSRTYLRWLGPRDFTDSTEPIVEELVRRVTALPTGINVRPDTRGVTGIASLFWVEGYGGDTLRATESAFGLTVEVSAQLVGVEWDFGDGSPTVQAGLGEAWPERSSVQHTYRHASGETPYRVTANLILQPSYTVNGVPGELLDPIVIPITRDYVVRQIQAVRRR